MFLHRKWCKCNAELYKILQGGERPINSWSAGRGLSLLLRVFAYKNLNKDGVEELKAQALSNLVYYYFRSLLSRKWETGYFL